MLCRWEKIPATVRPSRLFFPSGLAPPGSRIQMPQQKLVHAIVDAVGFQ